MIMKILASDKDVPINFISVVKEAFDCHCHSNLFEYRLPGASKNTRILVGLSGGADSSVLALFCAVYLSRFYDRIEYIFTDTKAEPDSAYSTLDKLESLLGIQIQRLTPNKGLFDLIDEYNGFLPSSKARWCTRELKVEPLMQYMDSLNDNSYISLAGIRYDEADREGITFQYSMENANAAFPFVDLRITKTMVFDILDKTIGIPDTYAYRSRSGCFTCMFQRNAEIMGMLFNDPSAFSKTEALEKLSLSDEKRWSTFPNSLGHGGIRAYYPVPVFLDIRSPINCPEKQPLKIKSISNDSMDDLFGHQDASETSEGQDIFVAYALYLDESLGSYGGGIFTPGVYWQEFVTLSTSLHGLKTALGTYYSFKKTTPMPQYEVDDLKIVIAQVRFPVNTIDARPPSKESFTWKSNIAYKQLRHLVSHVQLVLEHTDLERRFKQALFIAKQAKNEDLLMDSIEILENLDQQRKAAPPPTGKLIWEGLYTPSVTVKKAVQLQLDGISTDSDIRVPRDTIEFDEVPRACIACSI